KEEGFRVILVNSNPATIMTDPELADATYVEPITPGIVEKIIAKERPDALLPTMGGQTALNTALALFESGTLEKYGVEMIGANAEAIETAEDREKFKVAMAEIGLDSPRSQIANTLSEALGALDDIGLPTIIRPSFTLGGQGGGIAYNREEFLDIVERGLDASPTNEVLIEESVLGWKEFEMEVVRDKADNCIIICSIENVDPMGVHTGDSITVAPSLTLTDKEYQRMRSASIACLRRIGVETGGSNVQFAIHPETGRMVIIEMNPRVSRSSALASKATGFPIARVAAKLAVGYTLDEIQNDITKGAMPASFEPTIDYVVVKMPRFTFEKFPAADQTLTTSMRSVGEVMSVGRTFQEAVQKALRGLETGQTGFDEVAIEGMGEGEDRAAIRAALGVPKPYRILKIAEAMRRGFTVEDVHQHSKIDRWFLEQIAEIVAMEDRVRAHGLPDDADNLQFLKSMGFSDARLATLAGLRDGEAVRAIRIAAGVRPVFKRIDTCAAEFAAPTAYMYSTYETTTGTVPISEAAPSSRNKVVILGGGPNRIGQGIEFDYCCCHAAYALADAGIETVMVNCNPETVSTDFDTSDRLYFEPLTVEDVLEILAVEASSGRLMGVIVQFGGQTPLGLAQGIVDGGYTILGTSVDAIDLAEDRDRFQRLLTRLRLRQPENGIAYSVEQARLIAGEVGLPLVVRPSYVLGGRAMEVIRSEAALDRYFFGVLPDLVPPAIQVKYPNDKTGQINMLLGKNPLLFDKYLDHAIEVDVDALSDGADVFVCGIMEHIEEAGIHSGDSACSLPPRSLSPQIIEQLHAQTKALALALGVVGLMNVQYAIRDDVVYILEVNPRASRTVPFVAKTIGIPVAKIAARVMAGERLSAFDLKERMLPHVAVKEAVFPFARFSHVDTVLGPEMKSTGEVMGIDRSFPLAFAKSQLGAGNGLPSGGKVFVSVRDSDKAALRGAARQLVGAGFELVATSGTQRDLAEHGIPCERINKLSEGRPHIVDAIKNGDVQLVLNTAEGPQSLSDSSALRRATLMSRTPYYTTVAGALAAVDGIELLGAGELEVTALQTYLPAA
ncbi:MAG: carbamoyl-phosphate synthase large subunit, partial [Pseudomonadota bacterium]